MKHLLTTIYHSAFPETIIFSFAAATRFIRLGIPQNYMFDEVYHAFTAQEMLKGNPAAWEWWNTPPQGFAYEWTHPPLAKEFMVLAMKLFGQNSFGWRFFSAFFGTGIIILIYFIALKLFKSRSIALLAATIASFDGLLLAMSRIAMNDSYLVFFALLGLLFFLHKNHLLAGVSIGLALASKWTGAYGIGVVIIITFVQVIATAQNKSLPVRKLIVELGKLPFFYITIPIIVYVASYIPFFLGHHIPPDEINGSNWKTFVELQQQMWWYHTGLKATHAYQSRPWQWVLDLRSVWFYVDYKDATIANVYALGNPLVFWFGFISILFLIWEIFSKKIFSFIIICAWLAYLLIAVNNEGVTAIVPVKLLGVILLLLTVFYYANEFLLKKSFADYIGIFANKIGYIIVIIAYFAYFLPWVLSPRIMFLYHYTPSVSFLAIASGVTLSQFLDDKFGKAFVIIYLALVAGMFIYFFPLYTAIHIPKEFYNTYFWVASWK